MYENYICMHEMCKQTYLNMYWSLKLLKTCITVKTKSCLWNVTMNWKSELCKIWWSTSRYLKLIIICMKNLETTQNTKNHIGNQTWLEIFIFHANFLVEFSQKICTKSVPWHFSYKFWSVGNTFVDN